MPSSGVKSMVISLINQFYEALNFKMSWIPAFAGMTEGPINKKAQEIFLRLLLITKI
jgi:hypothetical protein